MDNTPNIPELIMGPLDLDPGLDPEMKLVEQAEARHDEEALDAHDKISAVDRHWQIAIHLWPALKSLGYTGGHLLAAGVDADMLAGRPPHPNYPRDPQRHLAFHTPIPPAGQWPHQDLPLLQLGTQDDPGSYGLVLANLPYHDVALTDPDRRTRLSSYHRELLASALDQTVPGGLTIALASPTFLDHPDPELRQVVSERADLVGAVRLPAGAMRPNSNAYSPTDLLFLYRRPLGEPGPGIPTAHDVGIGRGHGHLSEYWLENPDHLLGELVFAPGIEMPTVLAGPEPLGRLLPVAFAQIATTLATGLVTHAATRRAGPGPRPGRSDDPGPGQDTRPDGAPPSL
jgi:hypothetical protein